MLSLSPVLLELSARRELRRLTRLYGAPARAATAAHPALGARIDQQAAAVRDILEFGVEEAAGTPRSILLAGYARGLLEQANATPGWSSEPPLNWADAHWLHLRLAALCQLAAAGPQPTVARHQDVAGHH